MKRLLNIILNKYFITLIVFLIILTFFDQNNFIAQTKRTRQLHKTEESLQFLSAEIDRMEKELHELNFDKFKLEKYAREKYNQKRDHEDTYLIIIDSTENKEK